MRLPSRPKRLPALAVAAVIPVTVLPASPPASAASVTAPPTGTAPAPAAAGVVVPGTALPGTVLPGTVLPGTVLPGTVLPGTVLPGTVLSGAVVPGAVLSGAVVPGAVLSGAVVPSATAGAEPEIPASPAGRQLRWLLGATNRAPLTENELREHFSAGYLSSLTVDGVNALLRAAKGLRLEKLTRITPSALAGTGKIGKREFVVQIGVDGDGNINLTGVTPPEAPAPAPPRTWKRLDARLGEVAPRTGFLAAGIDSRGRCDVAHAVAPDTVRPLGSIFKLYVLGAVAERIRDGRLSWNTRITIAPELKSLGEDGLTTRPDGTTTTVGEAAELMISISDNTATDLLVHTVGREAVEATVRRWSGHAGRNTPFLTTREAFLLKGARHPEQARDYLKLDTAGRRAYLRDTVAGQSLSDITLWDGPREIDRLEWFGSPRDVCRAYAGLLRFEDGRVGKIMSAGDAGLKLSRQKWPAVWAKGGSETGVLNLSYAARSARGKTYVVTVFASNPDAALDERAIAPELISLSRGGFALADE
ncbi:serine hydrolase [Streptosporangium sp. DT93]|uniref:serine hydrolase n=1 Tax=Streptosporangium sp. DT93 TaxID=3393428 RepID=UPI003CF7E34D